MERDSLITLNLFLDLILDLIFNSTLNLILIPNFKPRLNLILSLFLSSQNKIWLMTPTEKLSHNLKIVKLLD